MSGLPSPPRWQYAVVWRYGPLSLAVVGVGMIGYGATAIPGPAVSIALLTLGFASLVVGVILPRVEGRLSAGTSGVAADLRAVHMLDPTYTVTAPALAPVQDMGKLPEGLERRAEQIKLGDVWDAILAAGFVPGNAFTGKRLLEAQDGRTILLHQRGMIDWAIVSDELLAQLAAWRIHPMASGKYPTPPDIDPGRVVPRPYVSPGINVGRRRP